MTNQDALAALARPVRHEVNNLLAALSGTAELMRRAHGASERDIQRAERLADAATRLQALLHAYLALGAPPPDSTAPAAVFDRMRPLVRLVIAPLELAAMAAAPDLPALSASPAALQAAVLDLARDAAGVVAPGATLSLMLDAAPGGARLHVAAMPPGAEPPAIFLPAAP